MRTAMLALMLFGTALGCEHDHPGHHHRSSPEAQSTRDADVTPRVVVVDARVPLDAGAGDKGDPPRVRPEDLPPGFDAGIAPGPELSGALAMGASRLTQAQALKGEEAVQAPEKTQPEDVAVEIIEAEQVAPAQAKRASEGRRAPARARQRKSTQSAALAASARTPKRTAPKKPQKKAQKKTQKKTPKLDKTSTRYLKVSQLEKPETQASQSANSQSANSQSPNSQGPSHKSASPKIAVKGPKGAMGLASIQPAQATLGQAQRFEVMLSNADGKGRTCHFQFANAGGATVQIKPALKVTAKEGWYMFRWPIEKIFYPSQFPEAGRVHLEVVCSGKVSGRIAIRLLKPSVETEPTPGRAE
ncbi:MAG: hypothetical protein ACE366_09530 [Bradymonadia bacterium]